MKKLLYLVCIFLFAASLLYENFGPAHTNRTSTILGFVSGAALLVFIAVYFNKSDKPRQNA